MTTIKFMEYNDSIGTRTNVTPLKHSINGVVYTPNRTGGFTKST
jgi:hypothetical protein